MIKISQIFFQLVSSKSTIWGQIKKLPSKLDPVTQKPINQVACQKIVKIWSQLPWDDIWGSQRSTKQCQNLIKKFWKLVNQVPCPKNSWLSPTGHHHNGTDLKKIVKKYLIEFSDLANLQIEYCVEEIGYQFSRLLLVATMRRRDHQKLLRASILFLNKHRH